MRAMMDEVPFHQLNPGTEIEMIKYRAKKELQASEFTPVWVLAPVPRV
jgi:hypothetical protein